MLSARSLAENSAVVNRRGRFALIAGLLLCGACALASCADTLQNKPIGPAPLESVIAKSHFPVYWAGASFAGMQMSSVMIDPSGAVTIKYGNCKVGGQYTCVVPLSIVTSPDNSFLPGTSNAHPQRLHIRGVSAMASQGARTLAIRTGAVVVSVYAEKPSLATTAAAMMAPLNEAGLPFAALPAVLPNTGFEYQPLPSQVPAGAAIGRHEPG